jgi:hypothetical protein
MGSADAASVLTGSRAVDAGTSTRYVADEAPALAAPGPCNPHAWLAAVAIARRMVRHNQPVRSGLVFEPIKQPASAKRRLR